MRFPRLPDAQEVWITYLNAHGWNAASHVPKEHVEGMVRVSRTGGSRSNMVQDQALMLFEVWHRLDVVSTVALDLHTLILNATGQLVRPDCRVTDTDPSGPVEYPDPNSSLIRYQFTSKMTHRLIPTTATP